MISQLSLATLQQWQAEGRPFYLVDVREASEHAAYNIGGVLMPLSTISQAQPDLPTDRPVVVYCKRGLRSQIAIQRWQARYPRVQFYKLRNGVGQATPP